MPASSDRKFGYRPNPQVSASQMAEYLSATSTRRIAIRREARFPTAAQSAQYNVAREGIIKYLADGARSPSHLARAVDALGRRHGREDATEWMRRDSRYSVEALAAFERAYNKLTLRKLDCRAVTGRQPPLDMWPTKVSVSLDLIVHQHHPSEPDRIGGALFLFSRGEASSKKRVEQSKNVAGLILTYCNRYLSDLGEPDPNLCLAIDVFGGVSHRPPGTFSRKLREVENACDEIAALWRTKTPPPAGYDGPDPD